MFKDMLLPINMSDPETWKEPLEKALFLARNCGARLHVMTVVPSFDYAMVENFFPVDFEQKAQQRVSKELHAFVDQHVPKDVQVQVIVAVGLMAAVGRIDRFSCPDKLVAYIGLNPSVHQSGDSPAHHGRISKRGRSDARR